MKLSKLLAELTAKYSLHGDVDVFFEDDQYTHEPHRVEYDANSNEVYMKVEGI